MKLTALGFALAAVVTGALAWTAPARAEACTNDIDCKTNGAGCGTDVCNWLVMPHVCAPAGQGGQGMDGWCTVDSDCKCQGQGAKCVQPYCTFTKPPAGGSGSTSGSGSAASGSATSGASSGSAGSGAATSGGATSGTGGASGAAAPASGGSSCSAGFAGAVTTPPYAVAAMALGACFLVARRRRR